MAYKKMSWVLGALLLLSLVAQAGPTVSPVGENLYFKVGTNSSLDDIIWVDSLGGGGRFNGYAGTTSNPSTLINLWCVDSQLTFNRGTVYQANILTFDSIGGSYNIRYEDLGYGSTGSDYFRIALPDSVSVLDTAPEQAAFRYRMAAWLITQYQDGSAYDNTDYYSPDDTARNDAIQTAIWAAMDTQGNNPSLTLSNGATQVTESSYWFNQAANFVANNYNDPFFNRWAVVSAWVIGTSLSNTDETTGLGVVQTFLTEVPEPGFYGLLALGLSGLWLAIKRRREAA